LREVCCELIEFDVCVWLDGELLVSVFENNKKKLFKINNCRLNFQSLYVMQHYKLRLKWPFVETLSHVDANVWRAKYI
jgi:hypothetical protein